MENLSRNEVIAIFALGITIIGTLGAAATVQKALPRFLLILLTFSLALTFIIYIGKSIREGKSSRELSKEEMVQEAKRQLAEEQAQRDQAYKEARERLERERVEREGAERAAKEAIDRDKVERDARETIAREDAVKNLRARMETEKAEQARKATEEGIIGRWKPSDGAYDLEFTKDGNITGGLGNMTYRVVDANHVEVTIWRMTSSWDIQLSSDTMLLFDRTYARIR